MMRLPGVLQLGAGDPVAREADKGHHNPELLGVVAVRSRERVVAEG
jgi:hypothetical protein